MILALDIASKVGWAHRNDAGEIVCGTRRLAPVPSHEGGKAWKFGEWLGETIGAVRPAIIAIERPFTNPRSPAANRSLAGLVATAHAIAYGQDIVTVEVSPGSWRKVVLGDGRAPKAASLAHAEELGLEPDDDNAADAVCVLLWAEKTHGDAIALPSPSPLAGATGALQRPAYDQRT